MAKYLVLKETVTDNVTGISLIKDKMYKIIEETDNGYFIDYDEKNQKNLKKEVKFNKYGFEKSLEDKMYTVIS